MTKTPLSEVNMKFQTISAYRIKSKALQTGNVFKLNGFVFNVYASSESSSVTQYYFVDSEWDSNKTDKIVPLAYLQVSKSSSVVKFAVFQPENWKLKEDSNELKNRLSRYISDLTITVP
jgi:hypothetical protein